jgi:hypothetical protein
VNGLDQQDGWQDNYPPGSPQSSCARGQGGQQPHRLEVRTASSRPLDCTRLREPIDESKFKTLNNQDKNFTPAKVERRLRQLDAAERRELSGGLAAETLVPPAQQISLSDPNSRSMATSRQGSDIVGCNVQAAVGTDVSQLPPRAKEMKARLQTDILA